MKNGYESFSWDEVVELLSQGLGLNKEHIVTAFQRLPKIDDEELSSFIASRGITAGMPTEEFKARLGKENLLLIIMHWLYPIYAAEYTRIHEQELGRDNIINKLKEVYSFVKSGLDDSRSYLPIASPEVAKVVIHSRKLYDELLKQVVKDIKGLELVEATSKTSEKISEETIEPGLINAIVKVKDDKVVPVVDALSPYLIDSAKAEELLKTGYTEKPVAFKGNRTQLGDLFRRLKDQGWLVGISAYTELAEWLSKNFLFNNKDKGGLAPVQYKSISKVLQEGGKYAKTISVVGLK